MSTVRKAWAFVLDGHVFYVLGQVNVVGPDGEVITSGTLLCDLTTGGQWYVWKTSGRDFWNMHRGIMWRGRILAADNLRPIIWELNASVMNDEDDIHLDIERVVTGFQPLRGSNSARQGALRATASVGDFEGTHLVLVETEVEGVYEFAETGNPDAYMEESDVAGVFDIVETPTLSRKRAALVLYGTIAIISDAPVGIARMRFSDDSGKTWSRYFDILLRDGDDNQKLEWRSLGRLRAPGRLWEISDAGGLARIDGLDADMDGGEG